VLDRAFSGRAPLVTVLDGHPHTLAFLSAITGTPVTCLGVSVFGQGGGMEEVHAYHGLDARSITEAALDLVDEQG
jgi:pyruvate dehydrogenase E1 component